LDAIETVLIRRAQTGDQEAFGSLVERHHRYVYNLALRVVGNQQDAEDLAQEAFIRAWVAIANFRLESSFRTWLFRIVTNLFYNRLPGLHRELYELGDDCLADIPDDSSPDLNPASGIEAEEIRIFLHRQIDRLPESQRLLVMLRYQQGLSYEDIARVVSLPLGTVKTGLFRAKERLRKNLQARDLQETVPWAI
jgi:RNA polymerase sigma-70 factor (ECF subfamily)